MQNTRPSAISRKKFKEKFNLVLHPYVKQVLICFLIIFNIIHPKRSPADNFFLLKCKNFSSGKKRGFGLQCIASISNALRQLCLTATKSFLRAGCSGNFGSIMSRNGRIENLTKLLKVSPSRRKLRSIVSGRNDINGLVGQY